MFKVSAYFSKEQIVRDAVFERLGSAKELLAANVLCYAISLEYLILALDNPNISAIITNAKLLSEIAFIGKGVIVADDPELSYLQLKNHLVLQGFLLPEFEYGVEDSAIIAPSAFISDKSYIGKNVIIGKNTLINDYTIIKDNCIIGDNCTIGNDGLYFKRDKNGILHKVLHSGGVYLKDGVEIMNNSMVQRSHDSSNFTLIKEGTKVSVNVNIGHSSQIGMHNLISGNVQIAGRVIIGNYCWIGTSSTISDSVIIGDNAQIKIGSIVVQNVKDNQEVSGNFAYDHLRRIRNFVRERK